jgi:hypothetical protein
MQRSWNPIRFSYATPSLGNEEGTMLKRVLIGLMVVGFVLMGIHLSWGYLLP